MNSQEMMKSKAKPGYWFVNIAKLDEQPNWQEQVKPYETRGTIFGYDQAEFLAKQYKG